MDIEPKKGELCLFSNNKTEFNQNVGRLDYLIGKGYDGGYIPKHSAYEYKYCKQIKIEK